MKKTIKYLLYGLLGLGLIVVVGMGVFIYRVTYGLPFYESEPPVIPTQQKDFSILLFSKTNGFPHNDAIEKSIPAFEQLSIENNWSLFTTNNAAVFNDEQLPLFDLVIWNNTTGKNLTPPQRASFRKYIESGGGFLGIHGSGDASHHWDWYYEQLIGARFSHHSMAPQIQIANLHLECDTSSFFCKQLPAQLARADEWYVFFDNPRKNGFTVLYTLDEKGLTMSGNIPILISNKDFGMGVDHPIIWYKCLPGGGRTFYSAMGHTGASFSEPGHLKILEAGIKWAGKLEKGCF